MGPSNKALWNRCGISATRSTRPVVSCKHPCAANTGRQLHFLADAPHVLKNIRNRIVKGHSFILPDAIKEKCNLPTNKVGAGMNFIHFVQIQPRHLVIKERCRHLVIKEI